LHETLIPAGSACDTARRVTPGLCWTGRVVSRWRPSAGQAGGRAAG